MTTTTVVNLRKKDYTVYIGRAGHGQDGYFGSPIVIGRKCHECGLIHRTRGSTEACFRAYFHRRITSDPQYRFRVEHELAGQVLGCFCKHHENGRPENFCHGDVYVEYLGHVQKVRGLSNALEN